MSAAGDSDDILYRRIPPGDVKYDHGLGRYRPSTGCFDDDSASNSMSCFSKFLLESLTLTPDDVVFRYEDFGLIVIPVVLLTSHRLPQKVVPTIGDDFDHPCNDAHVEVIGKKTGSVKKAMSCCEWYKIPPAFA